MAFSPLLAGRPPRAETYDEVAAMIVIADDAARADAARHATAMAGGEAVACLGLEEAEERLQRQVTGVVLLSVGRDHGPVLDHVLDRLDALARQGRRSIVAIPAALLDVATARLLEPEVELLVDPDPSEVIEALAAATQPASALLRDSAAEDGTARLRELSREVSRIARTLAALSEGAPAIPGDAIADEEDAPVIGGAGYPRDDAALLRAMIRLRRARVQFFDAALFADPAWDMLLDLAAARSERRPVAVSSLCIAAAVPPTTALRWMKTMLDRDLLVRRADPHDGRRVFIELSDASARAMDAYLALVRRFTAPAG